MGKIPTWTIKIHFALDVRWKMFPLRKSPALNSMSGEAFGENGSPWPFQSGEIDYICRKAFCLKPISTRPFLFENRFSLRTGTSFFQKRFLPVRESIILNLKYPEKIFMCWTGKLLRMLLPFCAFFVASCQPSMELANEALRIGDFERAIERFAKILDENPANREARYGMALSLFGKAEAAEMSGEHSVKLWMNALTEFRILSNIDSSAAPKMHSSALFYLARARTFENPQAKILGILDESILLDSTNYYSWNLKALALSGYGDVDFAQKIFQWILSENPDFSPAYSNLGKLYWEQGNVEKAWKVWSAGSLRFPENHHLDFWTKIAEDSLNAKFAKRGISP